MGTWEQEWIDEQRRVDQLSRKIDRKMKAINKVLGGKKGEVVEIRKNFWEDVTVNFEDAAEAAETAASIRQQAELLSEIERSHQGAAQQMKTYVKLKNSPYFGRIDFKEETESDADKIYLGISSFYDEETNDFLIYDWRAPISSLYYDHGLGTASYTAPGGEVSGEMELKRQYIIRGGKIKSMFDTGVTIGDELLQEVLGNEANAQMKSIVATIQKEQNEIIRSTRGDLLVVQGAAGCGKTSAALQRVAYLLYKYRETLNASEILLFSPNAMFNTYVANVLPELGEENMEQTTFQAYIEHHLGQDFAIETPLEQMEHMLSSQHEDGYEKELAGVRYKASLTFLEGIERYLGNLKESGMVFRGVHFRGKPILSAKQITEYFYSFEDSISIPNRLKTVSEWILKNVREFEKKERNADWVKEQLHYLDESVYTKLYNRLRKKKQYSNDTFNDLKREEEELSAVIVHKAIKPLRNKIQKLQFVNVKAIYSNLIRNEHDCLKELPQDWESIANQTKIDLSESRLSNSDATPYLFLKERIEGFQTNTMVKHVFIDEAQDYSPFQFAFIKRIFPRAKWTVLGDLNQSIYVHSPENAFDHLRTLFSSDRTEKVHLSRSYRSTRQIVEFTKQLLKNGGSIVPFNRDGQLPGVRKLSSRYQLHEEILDKVAAYEREGHQNIAVICKTVKESQDVYSVLKGRMKVKLMAEETVAYEKGVVVIPSYLAKGIEFDAVIIYDASNEIYSKESDRKLFYTVCTRAMHELQIFYVGEPCDFLTNVSAGSFQNEKAPAPQ
ncbi:RNA polymerase recycling motor HelD [Fictibacillus aquaticus]|uniref:Helicase n=1 Tax=Fictibacillus aquaticus TaxID=2021314 RepID=A0A235FEW0_9BACL|nr:RNA polymerase recycling motor HelD [Fictibacillus aquaticus]OYD59467.1 helicase [Fictibacillus aquaticus]